MFFVLGLLSAFSDGMIPFMPKDRILLHQRPLMLSNTLPCGASC